MSTATGGLAGFARSNVCCICGARGSVTPRAGGEPVAVTWRCQGCGSYVCFNCALTIPGSVPLEFYEATLCSVSCWRQVGSPTD